MFQGIFLLLRNELLLLSRSKLHGEHLHQLFLYLKFALFGTLFSLHLYLKYLDLLLRYIVNQFFKNRDQVLLMA
jgi:hypothetical protein